MKAETIDHLAARILVIILLAFTLTRYFVDGFALALIGRGRLQGFDLQVQYLAAEMLRMGENIYDFDRARELAQNHPSLIVKDTAPYTYPPFWSIIMVPLSYLPFVWAYRVWVLFQQALLLASLYLLARGLPTLGNWGWLLLIILAGNMYPVYQSVGIGQVNLLILFLLCLALYLACRGRFFWCGVVVGLAGMIKISPLLLIGLFVLQRKMSALVGVFIALVALTVFSLTIAGPENMLSFFSISIGQNVLAPIGWMHNLSPATFLHRTLLTLGMTSLERFGRGTVVLACVGLLGVVSFKPRPHAKVTFALLFSLWITATLLISPITWEHHLVMLLPAFATAIAALANTGYRVSSWLSAWLALAYSLVAMENVVMTRSERWWEFTGSYLHDYFFSDMRLLAVVGLFGLLIVLIRRTQSENVALVAG